MKEHILKTEYTVWEAIARGEKRFEIRLNDRFFQKGDIVILRQMSENGRHYEPDYGKGTASTNDLTFKIGWFLQGGQFGLDSRYCAFQLEEVSS